MERRLGKEVQDACMAQALRRAARAVSREYDAAFAPSGLSVGQFSTLAALDRIEPLRLGQLAEGLGMDRTTLNRNLAPLERKGLVSSQANREDARARLLSLTEAGRRVFQGRGAGLAQGPSSNAREDPRLAADRARPRSSEVGNAGRVVEEKLAQLCAYTLWSPSCRAWSKRSRVPSPLVESPSSRQPRFCGESTALAPKRLSRRLLRKRWRP